MLEAIYEIGKIQPKDNPLNEMTEHFGENYRFLFKIFFNISNNKCSYQRVGCEEIDHDKKERYLYKKGAGANAPDVTPIAKVTEAEKTFYTKILKSVGQFLKNVQEFAPEEEIDFLQSLDNELIDKREKILEDYLKAFGEYAVSSKQAAVLSLAFIQDGEEKYLGDLPVFSKNLLKIGYKSNYYKFDTHSKAHDKTCYMCKQIKDEVWGYASTFQFYTVDKKGMVTGGFNQANSWKNYPVCEECYIILERGKKYITDRLNFRFCGFNYFLLPQIVLPDIKSLNNVLRSLRDYKDFTLEKKEAMRAVELEESIFDTLLQQEQYANFDFLFYEEKQSGKVFNILLFLENITPSCLNSIIQAKLHVDDEKNKKYNVFTKIPKKDEKGNLSYFDVDFSFHSIRNFFLNSKMEGNFDNYFLDIIKYIFFLKPISQDFLLHRFMEKIRMEFMNENSVFVLTLSAYKILRFLDRLKILNRRRNGNMKHTGKYEDFFSEHPEFFDDDSKKAIFLEGVLIQKLLNIQQYERKAQPFRSRLNGLKIDARIAKRLLPEAVNKLEEYGKNFYREMEAEISNYFLGSDLEKYSSEELSFYFVLGMNLVNKFDKEDKEESKVKDSQENNINQGMEDNNE